MLGPERSPQEREHVLLVQRAQLVDPAAGQERRVHLEVRVLGRRAHEHDEAVLDRGEQRVLLRLVEAMDLVEEEDRALAARLEPVLRPVEHGADLRPPGVDRRRLLERGPRVHREQPRQRRLPRARRPVEDHRVRPALLDRGAQRRAAAEEVLLAHELAQRPRPHAGGERLRGSVGAIRPRRRLLHLEQLTFHSGKSRSARHQRRGLRVGEALRRQAPPGPEVERQGDHRAAAERLRERRPSARRRSRA